MNELTTQLSSVPIFNETIGAALIDAARITVMAALEAFPDVGPSILLPGDEELPPTITVCLVQAMQWLDAARSGTVVAGAPVTSIHTVERK